VFEAITGTRPRIMIVATVPVSFSTFFAGQPRFLAEHFDVTLVTSSGVEVAQIEAGEGLPVRVVEMTRQISPGRDLVSLRELLAVMRDERPDLVHSYTPKAGLLAMLAARVARVPHRFHTVQGMPLVSARGPKRLILNATERTTYLAATRIFSASHSLCELIPGTLPARLPAVIGAGSVNGIDGGRFAPDVVSAAERAQLRAHLQIPPTNRVVVFVGRLVGDKGITELVQAFDALVDSSTTLLLVGGEEPELDPLPAATRELIHRHPNIRSAGWVTDVRPYLAISDVLVLPSYREGFGMVLVEAGAMGVPVIATDITGCRDVVIDGVNGLLVPPRDAAALTDALGRVLTDELLRSTLAGNARPSMLERYDQPTVHSAILALYREALGLPASVGEATEPLRRAA
jgi:glycosyltransferase involved in cell wall biosynthesis